jgi:hypothetical protein
VSLGFRKCKSGSRRFVAPGTSSTVPRGSHKSTRGGLSLRSISPDSFQIKEYRRPRGFAVSVTFSCALLRPYFDISNYHEAKTAGRLCLIGAKANSSFNFLPSRSPKQIRVLVYVVSWQ